MTVEEHCAYIPCDSCQILYQFWSGIPEEDRTEQQYYRMTELFVMLHNGSDVCNRLGK